MPISPAASLPGYDFVARPPEQRASRRPAAASRRRRVRSRRLGHAERHRRAAGRRQECTVRSSSWHGTSVIGAIAANANNGSYLAGVDWNARIVPVRVLGKCYGDDPDTADAIMWAAGLPVPESPVNHDAGAGDQPEPGRPRPCPAFMQDAIDAALAHGVTRAIVARRATRTAAAITFPRLRRRHLGGRDTSTGGRATYSNYGPRVDLAAPGGFGGGQGFVTLTNSRQRPSRGATRRRYARGTSFSAPLVSGVAALMLAVAPGLSAGELRDLLKASAKPFPAGSSCSTAPAARASSMPAPRCAVRAGDHRRHARACCSSSITTRRSTITSSPGYADEIVLLDEGVTLKRLAAHRTRRSKRCSRPRRRRRRCAASTFPRARATAITTAVTPTSARARSRATRRSCSEDAGVLPPVQSPGRGVPRRDGAGVSRVLQSRRRQPSLHHRARGARRDGRAAAGSPRATARSRRDVQLRRSSGPRLNAK